MMRMFADQLAGRVEALDADVIEIDAPMHARMNIRLGDDQRPRLLQKRHDLRRELEKLVAAPEHPQFARAHDAERALEIRFQRLPVDAIVAQAEESEIVGEQPLQELDRLPRSHRPAAAADCPSGRRRCRRRARSIGLQSCTASAHFTEHDLERAHEFFARRVFDRPKRDGYG